MRSEARQRLTHFTQKMIPEAFIPQLISAFISKNLYKIHSSWVLFSWWVCYLSWVCTQTTFSGSRVNTLSKVSTRQNHSAHHEESSPHWSNTMQLHQSWIRSVRGCPEINMREFTNPLQFSSLPFPWHFPQPLLHHTNWHHYCVWNHSGSTFGHFAVTVAMVLTKKLFFAWNRSGKERHGRKSRKLAAVRLGNDTTEPALTTHTMTAPSDQCALTLDISKQTYKCCVKRGQCSDFQILWLCPVRVRRQDTGVPNSVFFRA